MDWILIPNKQIGLIKFDMTISQVIEILGKPSVHEKSTEFNDQSLIYDSLSIEICFELDDESQIQSIIIEKGGSFYFDDQNLITLSKNATLNLLKNHSKLTKHEKDEIEGEDFYQFNELGIELYYYDEEINEAVIYKRIEKNDENDNADEILIKDDVNRMIDR